MPLAYPVPESTRSWDFSALRGDPLALKFACRELVNLNAMLKHVQGRTLVLQAGGNQGVFPKFLAQHFTQVVTCEPDPENYRALLANARAGNITAYCCALGDRIDSVGLSRNRRDGSRGVEHAGLVHVNGSGSIPMWTIDSIYLKACDFIMLDVEGYELFVLRGAVETIQRFRPAIGLEVNNNLRFFGLTETDIDEFFSEQGYMHGATYKNDRLFLPCP